MANIEQKLQAAVVSGVFALPAPLRRLLAGKPVRLDDQELALDAQLLLKLQKLAGQEGLSATTPEAARAAMSSAPVRKSPLPGVVVAEREIPAEHGSLPARLYRPRELTETGPLLVFLHGGGWVLGDIDTHDDLCRFLAKHAGVRVLSVDYRLAPENRFPAAFEDALAAYRWAVDNAAELGSTADAIAVGGDSAGGNLAASIALHTTRNGMQKPVFQLLLYPATDATRRRRSRELFGNGGFLLTDHDMTWFMDHYEPDLDNRADPRLSPLLAEDHGDLPTAYVVTCGFDPLRDEGEAYAQALADVGVPVVARRFSDLIHGFANLRPISHRFEEALFEIVGTTRAALQLTNKP
jgi:acetyl esterase